MTYFQHQIMYKICKDLKHIPKAVRQQDPYEELVTSCPVAIPLWFIRKHGFQEQPLKASWKIRNGKCRAATCTCCQGCGFGLGCFFILIYGSTFVTKIQQQKTVHTKNISLNQQYLIQIEMYADISATFQLNYLKRIPQDYLRVLESQIIVHS